jgi:hypothetical protein
MASAEPDFWQYVREAFHRAPFVRNLGAVPWNKWALAAVGILGFGNPGFWLLGIAGELMYLYLTATNPRFRTLVRARRLEAERAVASGRIEQLLDHLSREARQRFTNLRQNCVDVQRITEAVQAGALPSLDEARWEGLDQLLWLFLRLQISLETLERQLSGSDRGTLEKEAAQIEKELAAAPEAGERLRKSKESLLELKKKRIENLDRASEARQILGAELQRIEQQVELLREEAAISRRPEALSARIDAVTGSLEETNSWMRQHEDILADLGGDEGGGTPRVLERPRQAATER